MSAAHHRRLRPVVVGEGPAPSRPRPPARQPIGRPAPEPEKPHAPATGQPAPRPAPATAARPQEAPAGPPLTDRERQVLRMAGEGQTSADIASTLHLSEGTVRNYLSEAISKVGASNRVEAARIARAKGWL